MGQHYTRNTVTASGWCPKCRKFTQHRIDDRRMGPCMDCLSKYLPAKPEAKADPQMSMFEEKG